MLGFGLIVGKTHCVVALDQVGKFGLMLVDGKPQYVPETADARSQALISAGEMHHVRCRVEPGHVAVEFDGRTLLEWSGEIDRLSLPPPFPAPKADCLFLAEWHSQYRIVSLTYVPGTNAEAAARLPVPSNEEQQAATSRNPQDAPRRLRRREKAGRAAGASRKAARADRGQWRAGGTICTPRRGRAFGCGGAVDPFGVRCGRAARRPTSRSIDGGGILQATERPVVGETLCRLPATPTSFRRCDARSRRRVPRESTNLRRHGVWATAGLNDTRKAKLADDIKQFSNPNRRTRCSGQSWPKRPSRLEPPWRPTPADATAHLTLGRYLCFVSGNWSEGLPHLAAGSDPALRQAAERRSASRGGRCGPASANWRCVVGFVGNG